MAGQQSQGAWEKRPAETRWHPVSEKVPAQGGQAGWSRWEFSLLWDQLVRASDPTHAVRLSEA